MPALSKLTPAQTRRQEKLAQDAARVAGGEARPADAHEPVSLPVMLSEGMSVEIGGQQYEAAPLPIAKLGKAGPLLSILPDVLAIHAMAAFEAGRLDAAATAAKLNSLVDIRDKMVKQAGLAETGAALEVTAEAVEMLLDSVVSDTTEEQAAAMVDLTHLVLSRRHPDLNRDVVEAELEMPAFLHILVSLYAGSPTLRRSFRPA